MEADPVAPIFTAANFALFRCQKKIKKLHCNVKCTSSGLENRHKRLACLRLRCPDFAAHPRHDRKILVTHEQVPTPSVTSQLSAACSE